MTDEGLVDFFGDPPILTTDPYNIVFDIDCPYCDRVEEFESRLAANIWAREHILKSHGDELPPFTNEETES